MVKKMLTFGYTDDINKRLKKIGFNYENPRKRKEYSNDSMTPTEIATLFPSGYLLSIDNNIWAKIRNFFRKVVYLDKNGK